MRPTAAKPSGAKHGTWVRFAVKSVLAVLLVGLPALFPDSVKSIQERHLSPALVVFAVVMIVVAVWEVVDKNRDAAEKQDEDRKKQAEFDDIQAQLQAQIGSLQVRLKDAQFAEEYTSSLTRSVNTLQYLSGYDSERLDIVIRGFLETIRAVVALSLRDAPDLELNVSVMRPAPFTEQRCRELEGELFFLDPARVAATYDQTLTTTHWASDNHTVPDRFSLPVHRNRECLLFGAPEALRKGVLQYIADITEDSELSKLVVNQPDAVREEIRIFFEHREYKSFASLRLEYGAKTIGVMNISSSHPKMLENVVNMEDNFQRYIRPFAAMTALALTYQKGGPT